MSMKVHFGQTKKQDDKIDNFLSSLNISISVVGTEKAFFCENPKYEVMVDYQIIFIQNGCFVVEIGNKLYNIKEGEIVVIPPFSIKSIYSVDSTENYYSYFHFDVKSFFMNETFKNSILGKDSFVINSNISQDIIYSFDKIRCELLQQQLGTKSILDLIAKEIIIQLLRRKDAQTNGNSLNFAFSNTEHNLLQCATIFIEENLNSNITVNDIAKHLQVSLSTLYKAFIDTINISPKNYIQILKAKTALLMLSDKKNKAIDISTALGFNSYQAFNKFFKKQFTLSLNEYRKAFIDD